MLPGKKTITNGVSMFTRCMHQQETHAVEWKIRIYWQHEMDSQGTTNQ